MTIWVARAGSSGERENFVLDNSEAIIGWTELGDLSNCVTKEEIQRKLLEVEPDVALGRLRNHAAQIWNFIHSISKGDIFALPLKTRPAIAIGKVVGDYNFKPENPSDARHTRAVEWIGDPIPRNKFDQDLLYSFGSALTVFRVVRNNAEQRVGAIAAGKTLKPKAPSVDTLDENSSDEALNILDFSSQQISDHIGQKFKGHKMEYLVAEVLRANGFVVRANKRKGSDGGADILAAKGSMGFESPKLCVQVKSSDAPTGSKDYDELKGVMQKFGADHGLFVSWGGFKSTVDEESRRDFYNIRLWNAEDLVQEVQKVYTKLPEELQMDIPLQQVWALVID